MSRHAVALGLRRLGIIAFAALSLAASCAQSPGQSQAQVSDEPASNASIRSHTDDLLQAIEDA